jgi:hypothetical protein
MTTTNLLRPTPLRIDRFQYIAAESLLVAEHSDLDSPRFERVYADACDEGITVIGRTGREVVYYLASIDSNSDGELCGWVFEPVPEEVDAERLPRVLIVND